MVVSSQLEKLRREGGMWCDVTQGRPGKRRLRWYYHRPAHEP